MKSCSFVRGLGLLAILGWFSACQSQQKTESHAYTNALIHTNSPYLLQHAHNPVDWYPWGKEALELAESTDKLLIVSVGYAACHWCHVMEHESFEDTAVAKLMNEHFVSIKVDREERPDVDQIYMNAAYLISGRGGWPLNAIALPDGRPLFAGTYFPKDKWVEVLEHFVNLKQTQPDQLSQFAEQLTAGIKQADVLPPVASSSTWEPEQLDGIAGGIVSRMDPQLGGLNKAPKFPMPSIHEFLLQYHAQTGDQQSLNLVTTSLDEMAAGGIYDQLGGGFARYSTDAEWKVPHFEKMLYDNGQLVSLYAHAYQLTKKPLYKRIVEETLAFVNREWTDETGGFYASYDADSEGEEGKFYTWTEKEIMKTLGMQAKAFKDFYEIQPKGNWEETNILYYRQNLAEVAKKFDMEPEEFSLQLDQNRKVLFEKREKRVKPGLDDKILAGWNGLMLKGYVDAYRVFRNPAYLETALKNAAFIEENMRTSDGGLLRNYKDGKAVIPAFADDYGAVTQAYIALYQATFDEKWLMEADELMQYAITHFSDDASPFFFLTSDTDDPLITRPREIPDNVIPSSNSLLATSLFDLGTYLEKEEYLDRAAQMAQAVAASSRENGAYYAQWAQLMLKLTYSPFEVAILGDNWAEFAAEWDQAFAPNVLLMGGASEGKLPLLERKLVPGTTTIYVCQQKVCKLPVQDVAAAREQMK
ncbi:thioredoxin domain-containing protein [Pontibacter sp. G13]|uniref:thioredoxin domain-containing protein n=1 Tax=Pontibacter sp. G13 TaxID=3074898 RepID=UPI00288B7808|nr:thioredoxin domain-containing protein [Pontibacter sp. G13]WNJ21439.1 thioredoxin domain-containing protein [Pontibacter sp. G13]